jgi:hypothetical protein
MIGLSIVLGLIGIVYFATTLDVINASEGSQEEKEDKTINLTNIPTPEQKVADEELRKRWLSDFDQLLERIK